MPTVYGGELHSLICLALPLPAVQPGRSFLGEKVSPGRGSTNQEKLPDQRPVDPSFVAIGMLNMNPVAFAFYNLKWNPFFDR